MLSLPRDCVAAILSKCDEPTRDAVAVAAPQLQELVDDVRYDECVALSQRPWRGTAEILPTRMELLQRGCLNPNRRAILQCMSRVRAKRGIAPEAQGPLRTNYEKVAQLLQAESDDLVQRVHTPRGFYLGGGVVELWTVTSHLRQGFGISFDTRKIGGSERIVYGEAPRKSDKACGWGVLIGFSRLIDPTDFSWRVRSCLRERGFADLRLSNIEWFYEGDLAGGLPHGRGTMFQGSTFWSGQFVDGFAQPDALKKKNTHIYSKESPSAEFWVGLFKVCHLLKNFAAAPRDSP